jgi:DNA-binding transcriptional LysR family regulator
MPLLNVTLRQLEVFVAIVEKGSFTAAAEHFGIAQPSVSAHVRALEGETGGSVFERRRGRKPALTDLGRSVLHHARELIAEADDLRNELASSRDPARQRVVFSCQRSVANFILAKQIPTFAVVHPEFHLVVRIGKHEEVLTEVRDGSADLGCFLSNEEIRGVRSEVIGTQRLMLMAAPSHPLAGRARVSAREIQKHGFVGPPPSSLFGRAVTRLLAGAGISEVKIVAQATEYQFLRELVAAGVGLSCSPEKSVQADVERGLLVPIDFDGPPLLFQTRLITSPQCPLSEAATALTRFLRENLRQRAEA